MELVWLGHSAFHLRSGGRSLLIDPFWTGNPSFPKGYEEGIDKVDSIVVTHGHGDHFGDAARLAAKYGAVLVAQPEVCAYAQGKGVERQQPMNIGGTVEEGGVLFSMVPALHSSTIEEDGTVVAMGDPAGMVIRLDGRSIYHTGDTGLFSDMALIQRLYRPTVGLVCIGDRFTMGPEAAAIACNEFLDLELVVPIHWGTFPLLSGDPQDFAKRVTRGRVEIPKAGQPIAL